MALTTLGKARIAALLNDEAVTPFSTATTYVGVGDGADAFDAADTDLQGASTARVAVTSVNRSGAVLTIVAVFDAATALFAWNEFGLFDAASGGLMLSRDLIVDGGTKGASVMTFTITCSVE